MTDINNMMQEAFGNLLKGLTLPVNGAMAVNRAIVQGGQAFMAGQNPLDVHLRMLNEILGPLAQSVPPEIQAFLPPLPNMALPPNPPAPSEAITEGGEIVGQPFQRYGDSVYTQIY